VCGSVLRTFRECRLLSDRFATSVVLSVPFGHRHLFSCIFSLDEETEANRVESSRARTETCGAIDTLGGGRAAGANDRGKRKERKRTRRREVRRSRRFQLPARAYRRNAVEPTTSRIPAPANARFASYFRVCIAAARGRTAKNNAKFWRSKTQMKRDSSFKYLRGERVFEPSPAMSLSSSKLRSR